MNIPIICTELICGIWTFCSLSEDYGEEMETTEADGELQIITEVELLSMCLVSSVIKM